MTITRFLNKWRLRQCILISIAISVFIIIYIHANSEASVKTLLQHGTVTSFKSDTLLARDKLRKIDSKSKGHAKSSKTENIKVDPGNIDLKYDFILARNISESAKVTLGRARGTNNNEGDYDYAVKNLKHDKYVKQTVSKEQTVNFKNPEAYKLSKNTTVSDSFRDTHHELRSVPGNNIHVSKLKNRTGLYDVDPWLKMPNAAPKQVIHKASQIKQAKQRKNVQGHKKIPRPDEHMLVQGVKNPVAARYIRRAPLNLTKEVFIFEVMRESKEERRSVRNNKCVLLKSHFVQSPVCVHDPNEDEVISATLVKQQTWEPNLLYVAGRILTNNPELKFLDLGCNLGVYTIVAAKVGIDVVAVDPNKHNLRLLTKALSLGGVRNKVTMLWNAVSNVHENVTLTDIVGNVGGSFVETADRTESDRSKLVRTIRIDDLIPFFKGYSVFIKIDIETYEWKALQGADKFFKEIDVAYVLMEWSYHRQHGDGPEIVDFMFERGLYPHINANYNTQLDKDTYESWPDNVLWIKYSNILVE